MQTFTVKLSAPKTRAVLALLSGANFQEASEASGVVVSTLWRWCREPDFKQALREGRLDLMEGAVGKIQQACSEAVETLQSVMKNEESPASSRVAAARCIIEMALNAVELQDIESRLTALEQAVKERSR
jgi:hypothetical protein